MFVPHKSLTIENLIEDCNGAIRYHTKEVNEWLTKVTEDVTCGSDPLYHLSWGNDTIESAARLKVAKWLKSWAEADSTENAPIEGRLQMIVEHVGKDAMRRAQNLAGSTSAMSNLCEERERQAWARALEFLTNEHGFVSL